MDERREMPGRWAAIDFRAPVPGGFLVPEHHYPFPDSGPLPENARVALNKLATGFSCEMFIFFERFVIRYLERHRSALPSVRPALLEKFIEDERVHVEAFWRLLEVLRPDLYGRRLRFIRWGWPEEALARLSPKVTFFTVASLFEEMSLGVPVVMEERPSECFTPVYDVMRIHAQEERMHIAVDDQFVEARTSLGHVLSAVMVLPILGYMDQVVKRGWRRAVDHLALELGLSAELARGLYRKPPSKSDLIGMRAFVTKRREKPTPGSGMICSVLEREIARAPVLSPAGDEALRSCA